MLVDALHSETLIKPVRGECFPFAPSIHRVNAALMNLKTAVATPLMLRYTLLRKALSTNGVVSSLV
jgi:hypothetical protein